RLIAIGQSSDDGSILAAGLGKEMEPRIVAQHSERGLRATGENDRIYFGMIDELPAYLVAGARHELKRFFRNSRAPETLAEFPRDRNRVRGRFNQNGISGGQSGGHSAARNGDREIPWRHHDH